MRNKTRKKKQEQKQEISDYILEILKARSFVFFSWGANNIQKLPDGLQFTVNGFLFSGTVKIKYNIGDDLFDIHLSKDEEVRVIPSVYADELVDIIDRNVECDGDKDKYCEMVMNAYNIK